MGDSLNVQIAGTGSPLVLVHGISTDSGIWSAVVPALARERTVITVDLPGFGRSKPVGEDFDLTAIAAAIRTGLSRHGVSEPYDLVGHSLGGGVAIQFAADHAAALRSLLLVAPAGLRPVPPPVARLLRAAPTPALVSSGAAVGLAARRSAAPLADLSWGRRLLLGLAVADSADLAPVAARRLIAASRGARRTGPALVTITTTDLRPVLAKTTMPVHAIWGESDRTVPIVALGDLLAARPDAAAVRLPGVGHLPMVEAPRVLISLLREWTSTGTGTDDVDDRSAPPRG